MGRNGKTHCAADIVESPVIRYPTHVYGEVVLDDTQCLHSHIQDVLCGRALNKLSNTVNGVELTCHWNVIRLRNTSDAIEEAARNGFNNWAGPQGGGSQDPRFLQLEVSEGDQALDRRVLPQCRDIPPQGEECLCSHVRSHLCFL